MQYNIDHLMARISRVHPDLVLDRGDLSEWVWEAMEDGMEYSSLEEAIGVELPLVEGRAMLPVNTFRILKVYGESGRCDNKEFTVKRSCILMPPGTTRAKADLLLFPADDKMSPLISSDFMPVAEAYCKMRLFTDGWVKGEIRGEVYQLAIASYQRAQHRHRASLRGVSGPEISKWGRILKSSIVIPR